MPSNFTQREAEQQLATVLQQHLTPLQGASIMGVGGSEVDWRTDTFTQRMEIDSGRAVIGTDRTTEIPESGVQVTESKRPVRLILGRFSIGFVEQARSEMVGRSLSTSLPRAVTRGIMQTHDDILFDGDATHDLYGLFTLPGVPRYLMTEPISSSASSVDAMIGQILAVVDARRSNTNLAAGSHMALGVTETQRAYMANTPRNGNSDRSILEWLIESRRNVNQSLEINTYNKLAGRGNSGGDLIVAYDPSRTDLADYVVPSSLMVSVRPIQVGATVTQVTYAGFTGGARSEYPVEAFTVGVPLGS